MPKVSKDKPYSESYPYSQPKLEQIPEGKQLFARDSSKFSGSKMYFLYNYKEMYNIIKTDKIKCYYENHKYNKKIKLHIDIDVDKVYNDNIDKYQQIDTILNTLIYFLVLKK